MWSESNVTSTSSFGATAWYPVDYFSALHPGAGVGIASREGDPGAFQLARSTVAAINNGTGWSPESGLQMSWIAAVRVGWEADDFVLKAGAALQRGMYPNLLASDGGGGLETTGGVLAVNEMLLQSHEGALRFFPVWPRGRRAAFATLRAVGGFLVSAALSESESAGESAGAAGSGRAVAATVHSTAGAACAVFAGKDGVPPAVRALPGGRPVSVLPVGPGRFAFSTEAGASYALALRVE